MVQYKHIRRAEEAERRVGQLDRGEVALIPGEVVFERIRRKYTT
jgi:hypothetical protein